MTSIHMVLEGHQTASVGRNYQFKVKVYHRGATHKAMCHMWEELPNSVVVGLRQMAGFIEGAIEDPGVPPLELLVDDLIRHAGTLGLPVDKIPRDGLRALVLFISARVKQHRADRSDVLEFPKGEEDADEPRRIQGSARGNRESDPPIDNEGHAHQVSADVKPKHRRLCAGPSPQTSGLGGKHVARRRNKPHSKRASKR